jgi:hypothetical protein
MAKEKTVKAPNYTDEMTADLKARYAAGESVDDLATAFAKTKRSVIAKLVREGVYKAPEKGTAETSKADGPQKKDLMAELMRRAPGLTTHYEGLLNVTKPALSALIALLPEPVAAEGTESVEESRAA